MHAPDPLGRANRFAAVAGEYERHRSQYPAGIALDIAREAALGSGDRLLEIGSGTGRATRLFSGRGFKISCVEPVAEMVDVARGVIGNEPDVEFHLARFEDWTPPGQLFDLAFSGQAFHWVDPGAGYRKLAETLRTGGTAALFWYTPSLSDPGLVSAIDRLYESLAPEIGSRVFQPSRFDNAGEWLRKTPEFAGLRSREYREFHGYTAEAWLAMLRTTSDHLSLPDERRDTLLNAIGEAIASHGGGVDGEVVTRLWLASKV